MANIAISEEEADVLKEALETLKKTIPGNSRSERDEKEEIKEIDDLFDKIKKVFP